MSSEKEGRKEGGWGKREGQVGLVVWDSSLFHPVLLNFRNFLMFFPPTDVTLSKQEKYLNHKHLSAKVTTLDKLS